MSSFYKKLVSFYFRNEPVIVVSGILIGAHIGWRRLQEIPGIGDPGRGYPHEWIVEVYSKGLKRQFYPEEYAEEQRLKKEQEEMENKK